MVGSVFVFVCAHVSPLRLPAVVRSLYLSMFGLALPDAVDATSSVPGTAGPAPDGGGAQAAAEISRNGR